MNREKIRKDAKKILDSFGKTLEGVNVKHKSLKVGVGGFRKEGNGGEGDMDFRKAMFANAPKVEGDCIVAEKKKW